MPDALSFLTALETRAGMFHLAAGLMIVLITGPVFPESGLVPVA